MDDLKMSVYISARNMIASTPADYEYICVSLLQALYSEVGFYVSFADRKEILEEFFHEFFDLYDGYWDQTMHHNFRDGKHRAWWSCDWKEPRLAILDFIINNR
jgi:hypothetical protein